MEHKFQQETIGELAVKHYSILSFFKQYQIDFYCHRNDTIKETIAKYRLNEERFLTKLNQLIEIKKDAAADNYRVEVNEWPLDLLANYIEKIHHRYTEVTLIQLKKSLLELIDSSPDTPFATEVYELVEALSKELGGHMKKEELVVFPFIRKLVTAQDKVLHPRYDSIADPIQMMEEEHQGAQNVLTQLRQRTSDYSISVKEHSFRTIIAKIAALDNDLIHHMHLENNILFPKAIELEKNK